MVHRWKTVRQRAMTAVKACLENTTEADIAAGRKQLLLRGTGGDLPPTTPSSGCSCTLPQSTPLSPADDGGCYCRSPPSSGSSAITWVRTLSPVVECAGVSRASREAPAEPTVPPPATSTTRKAGCREPARRGVQETRTRRTPKGARIPEGAGYTEAMRGATG